MMTIKQEYSPKELGIDLLSDLAGAFLFNIGIYNFAVSAEFAPVGVSGIALILRHLFGLPMGITSMVLNIPIVLVSYKLLGRRFFAPFHEEYGYLCPCAGLCSPLSAGLSGKSPVCCRLHRNFFQVWD
uniref:YitT family protein n=1 Tax=Clostridium sp. NkU-1 TaxID=1095009 RepID=UPI000A7E0158